MIGLDAYELGRHAYITARGIETNPFRDNTDEAKAFRKGWKAAQKRGRRAARDYYRQAKQLSPN